MDLIITILPVVTKDLPISPRFTPYNFLSRCKFSTLTTRQPMVEFYLLTFPRFPLRKKEHKSYFGKNRTPDFSTNSRCAAYLLDHLHHYLRMLYIEDWGVLLYDIHVDFRGTSGIIQLRIYRRYFQHAHFIPIVGVGKRGAY